LYKSLKDAKLKITPTRFGFYVIHRQGVQSCAWLRLLAVVHRYFVVCLVGVCTSYYSSKLRCQTPTKHTTTFLWTTMSILSQAQLCTPWWWIT